MSDGDAVKLSNKSGGTYSHSSSSNWDAVAAVESDNGFQVLLEGTAARNDQFKTWTINADGVIQSVSEWESAEATTGLGWEEKFSFDTNGDGIIGALAP